jgi:hypothetical protein
MGKLVEFKKVENNMWDERWKEMRKNRKGELEKRMDERPEYVDSVVK